MAPTKGFGYDPLGSADAAATPSPVDLHIRLAAPFMGSEEMDAVRQAMESGVLTNGPWTRRFERAMAERHGTAHAVAMCNGTVALAAALLAAGVGPGDEVIVPSLTFIATATSVLHVGAIPVFADVEPHTLTLDPDDVARRITSRTRAVVPVHYAGQMAQMDRLVEIASAADLFLLEDAAQAHGASFGSRPAGSWGDAAMFSFTPVKTITTGEGAMITTDDPELDHKLRLLRNHGMSKQYHHEILGWNWRITEMQSAIGVCQLDRLDGLLATKRANALAFGRRLGTIAGITPPVAADNRDHPYTLYTLKIDPDRRDAVAAALEAAGIETRIYFPPAHHQPLFAEHPAEDLPVTEELARQILSVPFHAQLQPTEFAEIADVVEQAVSAS